MSRRLCFYAPVETPEVLDRVLFYRQDLEALRQLGYDVSVATRWHEIRTDVDLIYVWWWTWAFVPLLRRGGRAIPVVITGVFDYEWPAPGNDYVHRPWWQRWLMRYALRAATCNVFLTWFEHAQVTGELRVTRPAVIPLSVDTARYAPAAPREPDLILSIGWLHEDNARRKGMYELVQAFALVRARRPPSRLVIAGAPGTATPKLLELCERLGVADAVSLRGAVSEAEKLSLLQTCSVYAQPTMFEGFGLAIAEAMSCGAPVVTCRGGAVEEVVGDAAYIVPRRPEVIAEALLEVLEQPETSRRLGARARTRVQERFAFVDKVAALREVLDGALAAEART